MQWWFLKDKIMKTFFFHYRSIGTIDMTNWPLKWHQCPIGMTMAPSIKLTSIQSVDHLIKFPKYKCDGLIVYDDNYGVKTDPRRSDSNNQHYYKWLDMVDLKFQNKVYETFRFNDFYLPIREKDNDKVDKKMYKQNVFLPDLIQAMGWSKDIISMDTALLYQCRWMQLKGAVFIINQREKAKRIAMTDKIDLNNSLVAMFNDIRLIPIYEAVVTE